MKTRSWGLIGSFLVLGAVACSRDTTKAPGGSTTARKGPPAAPRQDPSAGPCAADSECHILLDSCHCSCLPYVGETPKVSGAPWSATCDDGPPRNCGAASPCMNLKAVCDPGTRTCRTVR